MGCGASTLENVGAGPTYTAALEDANQRLWLVGVKMGGVHRVRCRDMRVAHFVQIGGYWYRVKAYHLKGSPEFHVDFVGANSVPWPARTFILW
ncbi:MAG TPA: hypothetical protein VKD22_11555 [Ramlibacter sp.]|nr:hypothetical protein [Ramlibacter sp.]